MGASPYGAMPQPLQVGAGAADALAELRTGLSSRPLAPLMGARSVPRTPALFAPSSSSRGYSARLAPRATPSRCVRSLPFVCVCERDRGREREREVLWGLWSSPAHPAWPGGARRKDGDKMQRSSHPDQAGLFNILTQPRCLPLQVNVHDLWDALWSERTHSHRLQHQKRFFPRAWIATPTLSNRVPL